MASRTKPPAEIKFKKLKPGDYAKINRRLREFREEQELEEKRRWEPKSEKIGKCHCEGDIVVLTTYTSEYNPMSGPLIIGPGSRQQYRRVAHSKCFCEGCGILYDAETVSKRQKTKK